VIGLMRDELRTARDGTHWLGGEQRLVRRGHTGSVVGQGVPGKATSASCTRGGGRLAYSRSALARARAGSLSAGRPQTETAQPGGLGAPAAHCVRTEKKRRSAL